jgi:imidazolonepropionase
MDADLILHNATEMATCAGPAPFRGERQAQTRILRNASIAGRRGRIIFVGAAVDCQRRIRLAAGGVELDASGCSLVPGFVDAHTHLVFAGDRRDELRRRLEGTTYEEIAADGGGILRTVAATRTATEGELASAARVRLRGMLACGTTTAEVKSGYGLTVADELKMLRAIRRVGSMQPVDLVPTFLGAHGIPVEYRTTPASYVASVVEKMLPEVVETHLAESCDVFCERGAFTVDQSRCVLEAARAAGLQTRVHANEFHASGGAMLAAEIGARSADHLIFAEREDARAMASAGTVATLLPAAAFYLKVGRYAPARMLIEEGVPVALGTDLNPGPGQAASMPFVITLACFGMGMTLDEAVVAATINSAYALNRHDVTGSLEVGKYFDAVVLNGSLDSLLTMGASPIRQVIKRSRVVFQSRPLAWGPRSRHRADAVKREE